MKLMTVENAVRPQPALPISRRLRAMAYVSSTSRRLTKKR